MDPFVDVDRFLERGELLNDLNNGLVWPWDETHFVARDICAGCGVIFNLNIRHFILDLSFNGHLFVLLDTSEMWCACGRFRYDHYLPDECDVCHQVGKFLTK